MVSTADVMVASGAPRFAGGATSITPPATLQGSLTTGGEDWFEAAVYLRWNMAALEDLRAALEEEQIAARSRPRGAVAHVSLPMIDTSPMATVPRWGRLAHPGRADQAPASFEGGERWVVHPHGCRFGDGGPCISWVIERAGIEIGLVDQKHAEPHKTSPSGFVRMRGETLTPVPDAEVLWRIVLVWLAQLGAEVVTAKVSRVDLCADLPNQTVVPLVEALREARTIRKALKADEHWQDCAVHRKGRQETGLYVGSKKSGVAIARIYDKAIECRDLSRRAFLIRDRWGCDPDNALRVEFQLRREFLTAAKCRHRRSDRPVIDTVQDYFDHRAELAEYLVSQWLRFVCPGHNPRHPERSRDLPIWEAVKEAFRAWAGQADRGKTYRDLDREEVEVEDLAVMIRGCAESIVARMRIDVEGPEDLLGALNEEVWKVIEFDRDIAARVRGKRKDLAVEIDAAGRAEAVPF